jgi:CelD/BcsL family acetyltransferase involved in cellulose biosynthesis
VPAVSSLRVTKLEPGLEPAWRQFLSKREQALFYASLEYRDLLVRVLGGQAHYFLALDDGQVCGVMPCFATSHASLGTVINSLPYYGSNGGFITDGRPEVTAALARAFLELEKDLRCAASTVVSSPFDIDAAPFERNLAPTFRDDRVGQITPLPKDAPVEDALFALYDETARRNVRKARKSGIEWRVDGSRNALSYLHRTHDESIRAIGGLPKSKEFFDAVADVVPQQYWRLYIAERGGELAAALLVFRFNYTVEYYTPAIGEAFRSVQPLALLVHEAMQQAAVDGYRWWNWGGTWKSQVGVYRFKRKWGALDMPYYYYTRLAAPALLRCTRQELLKAYPGFFVVPFDRLEQEQIKSSENRTTQ